MDQARRRETKTKDPGELISKNGHVQMMILHTGFSTGDVDKDRELVAKLYALGDRHAELPDVTLGVAGDAVVSLAEHDAILSGMLRATLVTVVLVLLALGWYFRSPAAIGALSWSLVVGTVATFAFARLTLGYLNAATAFLSSIVIGNGINVGILVTALPRRAAPRHLAERRARRLDREDDRGHVHRRAHRGRRVRVARDHDLPRLPPLPGIIGGVGILLCWISGYVVFCRRRSRSRAT